MLNFAQALELAETWVRVTTRNEAVVVKELTLKRAYGWVFFYQTRAFLASRDFRYAAFGNAPILVNRISQEIRITGTALPIESYLAAYEAEMPPMWLQHELPKEP